MMVILTEDTDQWQCSLICNV